MGHSPGFLAVVEKAKENIKECSIDDVRRIIDTKGSIFLVDVREDHEWAHGRLPTAMHLGRGIIERDVETRIPDKDATIILYCGGGFRSALAAESLVKMGYQDVTSMAGGVRAWKEAKYPFPLPD